MNHILIAEDEHLIARLRKKLGWADRIETVTKIGYRLKKE